MKIKVANFAKPWLALFANLTPLDTRLGLLLLEVFLFRLGGAFLAIFLMIISIALSP
jgi:hypothetical protein